MNKHPFRKFFGLTALYLIVIIGIFVLQFRFNSVFSSSFGDLSFSVSMAKNENGMGSEKSKDQMKVSYKGIVFSTDEKNPVMAKDANGKTKILYLESYEEKDNSVVFKFNSGSSVEFRQIKDNEGKTSLSIRALLPKGYTELLLPYKIPQVYSTEKSSEKNLLLTSKENTFTFTSGGFANSKITFSKEEPSAQISIFSRIEKFSFASIVGFTGTKDSTLEDIFKKLRTSLVEKVEASLRNEKVDSLGSTSSASLSESDITAYVAELLYRGKYNQAIEIVPDSFKKGQKRTFVSSPFFGNLAQTVRSLDIQSEKFAALVQGNTPDAFTEEGIKDYLLREKKSSAVKNLIDTVSNSKSFSAIQAAGILSVYSDLIEKDRDLISPLENIIDSCVKAIEENCKIENGLLKIINKQTDTSEENQVNCYEAVFIGSALTKFGKLKNDDTIRQAGNLLIYSNLPFEDTSLRTIAEIYPFIAKDNPYIPHTEILGWQNKTCIWAWTCAKSIDFVYSPSDTANIIIDFPSSLSHYIIFKGIPDFEGRIEIQGQMFRTDPRFETYNSSGYVYQDNTETLLIKSRHKSEKELIRLFFDYEQKTETIADPSILKEIPASLPKEIEEAKVETKEEMIENNISQPVIIEEEPEVESKEEDENQVPEVKEENLHTKNERKRKGS